MRTPGPYLREKRTIYTLESTGFRKGVEQFQNRIYAGFQGGPNTPKEEVETTAAYFQKAANCHDELVAALEAFTDMLPNSAIDFYGWFSQRLNQARKALDKVKSQEARNA